MIHPREVFLTLLEMIQSVFLTWIAISQFRSGANDYEGGLALIMCVPLQAVAWPAKHSKHVVRLPTRKSRWISAVNDIV